MRIDEINRILKIFFIIRNTYRFIFYTLRLSEDESNSASPLGVIYEVMFNASRLLRQQYNNQKTSHYSIKK